MTHEFLYSKWSKATHIIWRHLWHAGIGCRSWSHLTMEMMSPSQGVAGIQYYAGKAAWHKACCSEHWVLLLTSYFRDQDSVNIHVPMATDCRSFLFPTPFPVILQPLTQNQNVLGAILQFSEAQTRILAFFTSTTHLNSKWTSSIPSFKYPPRTSPQKRPHFWWIRISLKNSLFLH